MLIPDGYSRRATIGGVHFIYRPALASERRHVRYSVKFADESYGVSMISAWMKSKVEFCSDSGAFSRDELMKLWKRKPSKFDKLFCIIQGLEPDATGQVWKDLERPWRENLKNGIDLEINHRKVANRSCDHCQKYWYSEETGKVILNNSTGEPMLRSGLTLCQTPEGCPKGTPDNQRTLSRPNRWALQHFNDCDAVGEFPNDPIVKRNARIIRAAMEAAKRTSR